MIRRDRDDESTPLRPDESSEPPRCVDEWIELARAGDTSARDRAISIVYDELKDIARRYRRHGDSLYTTEVVHGALPEILKTLSKKEKNHLDIKSIAATAIRGYLLDQVKRRQAKKRGGGLERVLLEDVEFDLASDMNHEHQDEFLRLLDDAMTRLERRDKRAFLVVEKRFYGSMTELEIAEHLGLSQRTVSENWRTAKLFLKKEISTALGKEP